MNESIRPILIIEDNPMDLDLTRRAFFKRKVLLPIQAVRDGEEALSLLERWDQGEPIPVMILLDLKLPKVSGLDVLRQLKSHAQYRIIPVVILTTSSEDRDVREAYELGANSYIVKPVDYDQFMEVAGYIEVYWSRVNLLPR